MRLDCNTLDLFAVRIYIALVASGLDTFRVFGVVVHIYSDYNFLRLLT